MIAFCISLWFVFNQKTAYDVRISYWSSDVCSSDLNVNARWADVQAEYQRRANLIPNLVNTVKASVAAEDRVLTDVVNARARATAIQVNAEDQIGRASSRERVCQYV